MYNMNIVKTCHASLLEGIAKFPMAVDRVTNWASVEFVNDIVEQLVLLEGVFRG